MFQVSFKLIWVLISPAKEVFYTVSDRFDLNFSAFVLCKYRFDITFHSLNIYCATFEPSSRRMGVLSYYKCKEKSSQLLPSKDVYYLPNGVGIELSWRVSDANNGLNFI